MLERIEHESFLEIRLARPPVNALNPALLEALTAAFDPAHLRGVTGVVLSGGPKVFSGGLDVPHLMTLDRAGLTAAWAQFFAAARAVAHCPVPVAAAVAAGVPRSRCLIDPGIGFGKTRSHNLALLAALPAFVATGSPVLLGTSRKRFMGAICRETEPQALVGATCATTALGVVAGVKVFRVHDVRANRQAAEVAFAIATAGIPL